VFKKFSDDQLVELIVRVTNTYAPQKIQARRFIPLRSRKRDWKPVTKNEMYVDLPLSMLMRIIQEQTISQYFPKKTFYGLQSFVLLFLWILSNQSAILCISTKMTT